MIERLVLPKSTPYEICLEHLKSYDEQIYRSIKYIAEDPTIDLSAEDFTFNIMADDGTEVELVKNGSKIKVNNKNRKEYGRRVARYYLMHAIKDEMKSFFKGFY